MRFSPVYRLNGNEMKRASTELCGWRSKPAGKKFRPGPAFVRPIRPPGKTKAADKFIWLRTNGLE
jgi:hypothetical protein